MTATAAEYPWVGQWIDDVQGYCLTLARGLTPALFLERLGAQITVHRGDHSPQRRRRLGARA